MALRTASTAMARVERPEPREYSVSPTPTMQYLSLSVFVATGGLLWLRSEQAAERAEVEIEVFGGETEALADVADRLLEPHERAAHVLGLLGREAAGLHAADRLALHELAHELHEGEHEPRARAAVDQVIDARDEGGRVVARDALGPYERLQPRSERLELRRLADAPPLGAPCGQVASAGTEIVGRRCRRRRRRRRAEEPQRHLLAAGHQRQRLAQLAASRREQVGQAGLREQRAEAHGQDRVDGAREPADHRVVGAQRRLAHLRPLGHLADGGHEVADADHAQGLGAQAGAGVGPRRLAEQGVDVHVAHWRGLPWGCPPWGRESFRISSCTSSSRSTAQSSTESRA